MQLFVAVISLIQTNGCFHIVLGKPLQVSWGAVASCHVAVFICGKWKDEKRNRSIIYIQNLNHWENVTIFHQFSSLNVIRGAPFVPHLLLKITHLR